LSQYLGNAFALIDANGASGVRIQNYPDFVPGYSSGDHHPAVSHQDAFHVGLGDLSGWSSDRKPGYAVTSVLTEY
ncbi:hypothetical protein ACUOA8_08650, partial [Escherichia sp. SS-MK2]